ncbi:MAG: hypothetical protein KBS79_03160 [Lachnospiraceae bacterium]|nr:hypothetical protein [Candidatus Minthocola equi]
MEQKKHLPLRIVNSILLLASLAFCVIAMIKNPADTSAMGTNPFTTVCDVLKILMLAFGLVYMLMNYSKNASVIYKVFFVVLFIGTFIQAVYSASTPNYSVYKTVLNLIPVAAIAVLAVAKDLGKKNTMLLTIVFVLCRLVLLINYIINISDYGTGAVGILSTGVANLLIALTTGVMVIGKYLDKTERGTK